MKTATYTKPAAEMIPVLLNDYKWSSVVSMVYKEECPIPLGYQNRASQRGNYEKKHRANMDTITHNGGKSTIIVRPESSGGQLPPRVWMCGITIPPAPPQFYYPTLPNQITPTGWLRKASNFENTGSSQVTPYECMPFQKAALKRVVSEWTEIREIAKQI